MTETHFDSRITPAREDIAAEFLEGQVEAKRFVRGRLMRVGLGQAPLRRKPDNQSGLDTELLFGESVLVYEDKDGWSWLQSETDGYVGYTPGVGLIEPGPQPTHRVAVPGTHIYPAADMKLPPISRLSLGAQVAVTGSDTAFAEIAWAGGVGLVPSRHLAPLDHAETDFVAVAERLLHTPYLWGGRSSLGLDCSALVQLSLSAAGLKCPRDADMQEAYLGGQIAGAEGLGGLQRGDLVFWKGHVAIALDGERIVHANATAMAVSIDNAADFAALVAAKDGQVTSIRRIS